MSLLLAVVLAAATGDPAPAAQAVAGGGEDPLAVLRAQPQLIGVALALLGFIPLLIGWSLVRWASALLTAALTVAVVLVCCQGRCEPAMQWTAALSAGVLMGFAGFFLVQAVVALQVAVIVAGLVLGGLQHVLPGQATLALAAALVAAAGGALVGWWAAPFLIIAQCVLNGFLVILAGMIAIVKPADANVAWLALAVAVVTVIPGLAVQLRAHGRQQRGEG